MSKARIIKIAVSLVIFIIIIYQLNISELKNIRLSIDFSGVILIISALLISIILRGFRWFILMNDNQEKKVSFILSLKLLFAGLALNIFMPAGAGDVAKSYFGYRWTGVKERMLSVSLIDKLIAIGSLSVFAIVSFLLSKNLLILSAGILSILPLLIILSFPWLKRIKIFIRFINYFDNKVKRINIVEIIENLSFSKKSVFFSIIISFIAWLFTYYLLFLCFRIVGAEIGQIAIFNNIPYMTLGRLFPFTLSGMGSDEYLMIFLFSKYTKEELIFSGAIIYRILLILIPAIVGGIIILFQKKN